MRHILFAAGIALVSTHPVAAQGPGLPTGTVIDTLIGGLDNPWSTVVHRDGRILVNERNGVIHLLRPGSPRRVWARLPILPGGAGLLGMALDREHDSLAVVVTGAFPANDALTEAENRVYRLVDSAGIGVVRDLLVTNLPSARAHAGSAVAFGPDGKLYVTLGDTFVPDRSQDPASPAGKVLRFERDGSIPTDNPRSGSPVYASGLRNPQGLAWHRDGSLFATEHGPSNWPWENGRTGDDELNGIVAGGNYGWPRYTGDRGDAPFLRALRTWDPAVAPSGLAFYEGPYQPWQGNLFIALLRGRRILRLQMARVGGSWRVVEEEALLAESPWGRFRSIVPGPDGHLYITTSNRRTAGGAPDDLVLRIRLPAPGGN